MKVLFSVALCLAVASSGMAQRRGGGGFGGMRGGGSGGVHGGFGGGGFSGGGYRGGGFTGGGFRGGGFAGNGFRGFNGARGFNGFRGGFANFNRGFGFRGFGGWGYGGWGLGLGLGWDFGYDWPYYGSPYLGGGYWGGYAGYGYPYDYGSGYAASPAVTVVYPQQSMAPVYAMPPERANPVTHEYDQYGQEVRQGGQRPSSPIYLFAFEDHVIRAANAYWVDGKTLHYVTLQHEEKQAPLDTLDRGLTLQLNRERQVAVQLP